MAENTKIEWQNIQITKPIGFYVGWNVKKATGYKWPGIVVADYFNLSGQRRFVVECTAPDVAGAQHIFNGDQLHVSPQSEE